MALPLEADLIHRSNKKSANMDGRHIWVDTVTLNTWMVDTYVHVTNSSSIGR